MRKTIQKCVICEIRVAIEMHAGVGRICGEEECCKVANKKLMERDKQHDAEMQKARGIRSPGLGHKYVPEDIG